MTIRQTLRGWLCYLFVSILLIGVLARGWQDNGYNHTFRVSVLASLCLLVLGLFLFGYRCPRCRSSLLHKAAQIQMSSGTACPQCGVSLDEKREA